MSKTSMKAKQLASQLIPRYFKFFPSLSTDAFNAHMDCIDDGDLGVCTLSSYLYRLSRNLLMLKLSFLLDLH